MANYLLVYHGGPGMPATPEEGAKVLKDWNDWFAQLGDAVVDGGNPASQTRRIAANGTVSADPAGPSGYSVIRASSLDDAVAKAKGCPVLVAPGAAVQVVETFEAM
ncbi:MAG: hypothetical protein FJ038_10475 [Chloroflexi bacterium]|nr:hypothetical protein [Chloroflexota bacterium]